MNPPAGIALVQIAAEIGQRHAAGEGKGKGLILRRGRAMREPGRDQREGHGDDKRHPVQAEKGVDQHAHGMAQPGSPVKLPAFADLRQIGPSCVRAAKAKECAATASPQFRTRK